MHRLTLGIVILLAVAPAAAIAAPAPVPTFASEQAEHVQWTKDIGKWQTEHERAAQTLTEIAASLRGGEHALAIYKQQLVAHEANLRDSKPEDSAYYATHAAMRSAHEDMRHTHERLMAAVEALQAAVAADDDTGKPKR